MRHDRAAALLAMLLLCLPGAAEEAAKEPRKEEGTKPPEFEQYQLVLLKRGPKWTSEVTDETKKIQEQHLAHLQKMWDAGKCVVAGPFSHQEDETLRGMCLYAVGSADEARVLASDDPAVKAGRLKVEVTTWWVEKGVMVFPKTPGPR